MSGHTDTQHRVLILAPRGRDAAVIKETLARSGTVSRVCVDSAAWCEALARGAGAAIVTEESLGDPALERAFDWVEAQPTWSDFPFVVLAVKQSGRRSPSSTRALERLGNVVLVERPINAETLTSAAASALRARTRQYQARRHLEEREEAQDALRASQAELSSLNATLEQRVRDALAERKILSDIFETNDAYLQALDLDRRLLAINRAAALEYERALGRRPVIGETVLDYLKDRPEHHRTVSALWNRALAGEAFTEVQAFRDGEAGERHYEIKFDVLRGIDGRQIGAYQIIYDVSERVQHQERLREAEEQLRQAQKIEAIGQLTGGIAHDFNNLLMVVSGGLSVFDRQSDPLRRQRIMDGMKQAVQRGATLTRQLLAFSRKQPLKAQPVDLTVLVGAMRELLDRSLRGDIHVETDFPDDLWPTLVDPGELELVILNLAVNARDAMDGGGMISIRAENRPGHPVNGGLRDVVQLSIADTGHGMAPDVLARVFEPFFTTKDVGKGSGLGLAQVHGFAQQSGGAAVIDSEVGRGTTVTLYLPRSMDAAAGAAAAPRAVEVEDIAPASSGSVLLVEDDQAVAASVSAMLERLGFAVSLAQTAERALAALADGPAVDLVLSDVMMPGGMSGLDLAREVRRRRPEMPVILASGYPEAIAHEASAAGFALLSKPFELGRLQQEIAAVSPGR